MLWGQDLRESLRCACVVIGDVAPVAASETYGETRSMDGRATSTDVVDPVAVARAGERRT